ncbi:hypothetical protein BDW22DRAFT_1350300 [Trametopsis cervina]|nr:hypothetical protein BDW22DRAFT_1350300 [Trametopsis cervina]
MSRRPIFPLVIAGFTGILSGVYIFKPILENQTASTSRDSGDQLGVERIANSSPQPSADTTLLAAAGPSQAGDRRS